MHCIILYCIVSYRIVLYHIVMYRHAIAIAAFFNPLLLHYIFVVVPFPNPYELLEYFKIFYND